MFFKFNGNQQLKYELKYELRNIPFCTIFLHCESLKIVLYAKITFRSASRYFQCLLLVNLLSLCMYCMLKSILLLYYSSNFKRIVIFFLSLFKENIQDKKALLSFYFAY